MTMKRNVLAVSLPVLVCLLCMCLVADAVAGPPVPRPTRGRQPSPIVINVNAAPDLVVQKVTLLKLGGGEFPEVDMLVTVKNIGNKESAPCRVALCLTSNMDQVPVANYPVMVQCPLISKKIKPNATWDVEFHFILHEQQWKGMGIAVVDPPTEGKPYGQVSEWPGLLVLSKSWIGNYKPGERNNAFGFTYGFKSLPLPFTWTNPAVP